jgi:hypothetical protein
MLLICWLLARYSYAYNTQTARDTPVRSASEYPAKQFVARRMAGIARLFVLRDLRNIAWYLLYAIMQISAGKGLNSSSTDHASV